MSQNLYLRYLGVLGILADCSVHLRESGESQDLRERIETAMDDACNHHPLQWRRVLNRIEIEPKS